MFLYFHFQEFTIPSFDASHPAGNNRDEEWERKLREEEEQDYSTNWGNYEAGTVDWIHANCPVYL